MMRVVLDTNVKRPGSFRLLLGSQPQARKTGALIDLVVYRLYGLSDASRDCGGGRKAIK